MARDRKEYARHSRAVTRTKRWKVLRQQIPYGVQTELAPGRHEVIAARAFADRIEAGEDIHLLFGHDYDRPLASRGAGSLTLTDTPEALVLEARIEADTTWARDFLAAYASGLIRGLSPGFRVQPGGERIERRGMDTLRTITRAALFEMSAVTRPAYPSAQIEARAWVSLKNEHNPLRNFAHPLNRWRA